MKNILACISFFFVLSSFSQEMIIGETNTNTLESETYSDWYSEQYKSYKPNERVVEKIKYLLRDNNYSIDVYFGTWCSDSQRELPKLIKLLRLADFDMNKLNLTGVDRNKVVPNITDEERAQLNITNVPTIIVYKDGKEFNRFVEYAQESLEQDFLKIVSGSAYKHSYKF